MNAKITFIIVFFICLSLACSDNSSNQNNNEAADTSSGDTNTGQIPSNGTDTVDTSDTNSDTVTTDTSDTNSDTVTTDTSDTNSDTAITDTGDSDSETQSDSDSSSDPAGYLCDVGLHDGNPPAVLNVSNFGTHDPTMIKVEDTYYMFWTGHYIPAATSTNLINWSRAPAIYGNTYPQWSIDWLREIPNEEFNFPWAPDISYFGGKFHIYSSFSAIFGRNISCITHLTADSITGPWTDHGPVYCTDGSQRHNAIDADVELDQDGTPWLSFGSFWDGIMLFKLDLDGNRADNQIHRIAWNRSIEAPVIFRRCGYYYLFVSFGSCCNGVDSTYNVRVGRSTQITGPYYDKDGVSMMEGGGTMMVQGDGVNFAAAGHSEVLVDGDKIYHFYHAYRQSNGQSVLRIVEMPFDSDGWPVPAGP